MTLTVVAAVTLYIAAIFQGGQLLGAAAFQNQEECNQAVEAVVDRMGEEHKEYQWVVCEAVTVGQVGAKESTRPSNQSVETP